MTFLFLTTLLFGQTSDNLQRQTYSDTTKTLLSQLDSILKLNPILEFRTVGDGGRHSDKFIIYTKLVGSTTTENLLSILNDSKEFPSTRGYAYMAYAFKCDSQKKKEKKLNYNFKIHSLNGCLGYTMTFNDFKTYCRKRNCYDPNPKNHFADKEEGQVIKVENKIRKEQGENESKD